MEKKPQTHHIGGARVTHDFCFLLEILFIGKELGGIIGVLSV